MAVIKVPKHWEDAIKYACAIYAIPVTLYTDETNDSMLKMDAEMSTEESWLVSAEVQLRLREIAQEQREKRAQNDSLFDSFRIDFNA